MKAVELAVPHDAYVIVALRCTLRLIRRFWMERKQETGVWPITSGLPVNRSGPAINRAD